MSSHDAKIGLADPWRPLEGCTIAVLVRADTAASARLYAQGRAGQEARRGGIREVQPVWLNPALTGCEEIPSSGDAGVVRVVVVDDPHGV